MHSLLLIFALLASAAPQPAPASDVAMGAPAGAASSSSAGARSFGEPSLAACAHAMENIAWNSCDSDADAYVFEDGKYTPPFFRVPKGAQRSGIPAGLHRVVIFCRAGQHPVEPTTGAFLEKPGPRLRCASDTKSTAEPAPAPRD